MKIGFRSALLISAVCPLLFALDCGGKGTARPSPDESGGAGSGGKASGAGSGGTRNLRGSAGIAGSGETAPGAACGTPTADDYVPVWMPPKAVPGACTKQQISDEYALCQVEAHDQTACRAFNTEASNRKCLDCLFSSMDASESAAILLLQDGYPVGNVGGCITLYDGDSSDTSCGARTQAADICEFNACLTACTSFPIPKAEWSACLASARSGPCAGYFKQLSCAALPRYAACEYSTFADFFNGMGDLFCGAGPPSQTDEAGASAGGSAGAGP